MRFLPTAFLAACAPIRDLPPDRVIALGGVEPGMDTAPALLDFGDVSVAMDVTASLAFTLRNEGSETLSVTGHDTPIGDDAFTVHAAPVIELPPGAEVELDASYTPTTDGASVAELHVSPGDASLVLLGRGLAPVARALDAVVPDSIVGCQAAAFVPVLNDGSEPLSIRGAVTNGEDFSLDGHPGEIPPGGAASIPVAFSPSASGSRSGTLVLSTNDPATPELTVALAATALDGAPLTESFFYQPGNLVDVLVLVQGGEDAAAIVSHYDAQTADLVDALRTHNVDFHVAALRSDSACPHGDEAWAGLGDTSATLESVLRSASTGSAGAWDTDLLGLALEGLGSAEQDGCLSDFRREAAELHLVLVAVGAPSTSTMARVAAIQSAIGVTRVLRVSVIAPQGGSCGESADAFVEAAGRTGGRIVDACEADWASGFDGIVAASEVQPFVSHYLGQSPILGSILVTVDGAPFSTWTYDPASRSVVFDGAVEPPVGAAIEVSYVPLASCG